MARIRIGSRRSALAQAQSRWVAERLMQAFPGTRVELVFITTSGDQRPAEPATGNGQRPAEAGGLKALFTKELEDALLDGRIDMAVHSLKDMPAELPPGLQVGAFPEREDPRDVWISKSGVSFDAVPVGARVATGAVRRLAQLRHRRPDLDYVAIRGNVDTRLEKLARTSIDGLILAMAGLKRLGREKTVTEILPTDVLLPAIGQGCLAVETRQGDDSLESYLQALDHEATRCAALCERAFLRALGGSCQTPVAALAHLDGDIVSLTAAVFAPDGRRWLRETLEAPVAQAQAAAVQLADRLLAGGARALMNAPQ